MAEVALRDYVNEIDGMIENSAFDVAIQHCRHLLSLYPRYLEVYRVLGKALLEKDDYAAAGDVFRRVISVDPEDFVARVGLSIVHDRQEELDRAIWHMERAYDLMPGNEIIQSELRRLCQRRDGRELERISLTRSALARMYANGDLTTEAITSLRQLLHDQPDRADLQVLLAEVLWRDNQRIEAADLAQAITARLPYCLKANLVLGEILAASGSHDSETPFRRAQAVDPDNVQATQLFGSESPLPVRETRVARLEQLSYSQLLETDGTTTDREEVPDWLRGLADLNTPMSQLEPPESATNPPLPTGLHMPGTQPLRGEIPDWLQGLTAPQPEPAGPSHELPGWLAAMGTASLADTPAESTSTEPSDDWLAQLQTTSVPEPVSAMRDEEVPDWIIQLGTGELDPRKLGPAEAAANPAAEEASDWMKQLGATGTLEPPTQEADLSSGEEVPDWLRQLGTGSLDQTVTAEPAARSAVAPTESMDMPDWLQRIGNTGPLDQTAATEPTDAAGTPDWLSQLQSTVSPLEPSTAEDTPDWLTQLGSTGPLPEVEVPPAARKITVDTDRATVERLVEAFSPSVDRPEESVKAEAEEQSFSLGDAASEVGKASAGLVLGGAALAGAVVSGLTGGRDDQSDEEAAALPEATESASMEAAAILEGDISPDDALAFFARLTAGKEDQLRAEAEAEGESRMAAIMGRKTEPVVEAKPVEPEPAIEPVAEVAVPEVAVPEAAVPEAAVPEAAVPEAVAVETPDLTALEGDVSPDDALAFFARLTAGKEDQLRAEAEAEGESRMAAIMGRKPTTPLAESQSAEREPALEPVAEAAITEVATPEPIAAEAAAILEGEISPDDALAFFARLTAGKEDQLRAEAEAEGESRMAAIMGRKPTAPLAESMPVAEAEVTEVTVPEAIAPETSEPTALDAAAILEGDISPDDALAFFARLTAGKEDQLRAEAEAEGESRMATIMGRKPTAPLAESQSVEPEKPIEPLTPGTAIESESEEAVSTGSPADWLAQLGVAAASAIVEAETEPAVEEPRDWVKEMSETAPAAAAPDELPDWLRAMRPPDDLQAAEPVITDETAEVEATPAEELPDWLRSMQPADQVAPSADVGVTEDMGAMGETVSELPDWLRDLQPAAAELTPAEALPDWLRNLQPESIEVMTEPVDVDESVAELPQSEEAPVVTQAEEGALLVEGLPEPILTPISTLMQPLAPEVRPEPESTPPVAATPTWWTQSAEDEGEAPIAELPEPVRQIPSTARVAPAASRAPAVTPRPPITRAMRDRLPERSTRESRRREVRPTEPRRTEAPVPAVSSVNVDPLVEQLETDKFNHTVRLELARAWWSMGNRDSALAEYGKLINPAQVENLSDEELAEIEERDFADAGPLADDLIVDLERIVEIDDHPAWPRLLGDIYMKTGDLARALEMYRRALSQL